MRHGSTLAWVLLGSWAVAGAMPNATAGAWSLPDSTKGTRVAPILLLSRPDVQGELRMTPGQVADANRIIVDIYRKAASTKKMSHAAAIEARKSVDEEHRRWLETKLSEEQVERLGQIDLRWEGIAAIASRPAVAEALSLSDEQRIALGRSIAERNSKRTATADRPHEISDPEHQLAQQAWSILDDGQKRRWEKMLGKPFTVQLSASPRDRAAR